jgi:methionine synthase II (cobalamin-independent)
MLMRSDRILVSHVGSLPRSATLSDLLISQEAGEPIDAAGWAREVEIATAHVIGKQVEAGVDVGNDGEQSRVGFQTCVPRCLCGFGTFTGCEYVTEEIVWVKLAAAAEGARIASNRLWGRANG